MWITTQLGVKQHFTGPPGGVAPAEPAQPRQFTSSQICVYVFNRTFSTLKLGQFVRNRSQFALIR